jgi:hypothetical protein
MDMWLLLAQELGLEGDAPPKNYQVMYELNGFLAIDFLMRAGVIDPSGNKVVLGMASRIKHWKEKTGFINFDAKLE